MHGHCPSMNSRLHPYMDGELLQKQHCFRIPPWCHGISSHIAHASTGLQLPGKGLTRSVEVSAARNSSQRVCMAKAAIIAEQ